MTDKNVKNPNDDLAKAREEALQDEEAKEVTAVYGDSVSGAVNATSNDK